MSDIIKLGLIKGIHKMTSEQNMHYLVNARGYMFAVAQGIELDLAMLADNGVTVAKDAKEMLDTAGHITEQDTQELEGCEYIISKSNDQLMIEDMRGVNVPLEADNLADYIIKYEM